MEFSLLTLSSDTDKVLKKNLKVQDKPADE